MINNSKNHLALSLMLFLSSLDNLSKNIYIFQKSADNFEIRVQNILIFGKGCCSPLSAILGHFESTLGTVIVAYLNVLDL